ncbi:MAG: hypothetical protein H6568_15110 [Lewinellaceae bacterium]|nr:hypothetical protein [Saprospiraceae bacterium]MCB9314087.1 hypothetical protein [Lewinellaceae bacterium]HRW76795.1 hypothetical protein [Saprospiraceae bacterium]
MKPSLVLFIALPLCCACLPTIDAAVYSPSTDTVCTQPFPSDRGILPTLIRELSRGWPAEEQLDSADPTDQTRHRSTSRGFGTGDWLAWSSIALFFLALVSLSVGALLFLVLILGGITTSIWAIVDIRKYPEFNTRSAMVIAIIGLVLNLLLPLLIILAFMILSDGFSRALENLFSSN